MPVELVWIAVIMGLFAGMLVNYLADVLPFTRRFSRPQCVYCAQPLAWKDNLLFRRCPGCGRARPWRTWLVLAFFLAAAVAMWLRPIGAGRLGYWVGLPLLVYFGVVVVIDFEHRVVLTQVSVAGAVIGALLGVWLHGYLKGNLALGILSTLGGGLLGFVLMLGLYTLGNIYGKWLARRKGREIEEGDALGFGDVYMTGILGMMLGFPGVVLGLVFGIVLGGVIALLVMIGTRIAGRYDALTAMAYAPYLVAGTAIILYLL